MSKVLVDADERILDKLRKLNRKYESIKECSTEAEAQEFARKIQELLTKHKLDASEVQYKEEVESEPIEQVEVDWASIGFEVKKRRIAWHEDLARFVCRFNFCRFVVDSSGRLEWVRKHGRSSHRWAPSSRLWFVGKESDVRPTVLTYLYLAQVAAKIADKEYVRYFNECRKRCAHCGAHEREHVLLTCPKTDPMGRTWKFSSDVESARGFRSAFLEGFCIRLGQRYQEEQDRIKAEYAKDQKALVRLTDALEVVKNWMDESGRYGPSKGSPVSRSSDNDEGYRRGGKAADSIPLGRNERMVE